MKSRSTTTAVSQPRYFPIHLAGGLLALLLALLLFTAPAAHASAPQIPWECSTYEGAAQARCLNAFYRPYWSPHYYRHWEHRR